LSYHAFDLRPKAGIALALHVAGSEYVGEPGILRACHGICFVIHAVVAQNLRSGGVCRGDLASAVNNALGLIKVHGFRDVVGNNGIVLPYFGHAVDLHCQ
jgi:hypothetical protein